MTLVKTETNAILLSLHGDSLGLTQDGYLTGRGNTGNGGGTAAPAGPVSGFKGDKVRGFAGLDAPVFQGNDYKLNPYYHNTQFDDFLGHALDTFKWNALAGSNAGTGQTPAIVAANGGAVQLETGGGSTYTMAVNGTQITGALNFYPANTGDVTFETRLGKASQISAISFCAGLIDSVALSAPFTISGTTITANATNAAAFVMDANATGASAGMNCVAVNAGGSAQSVNLGTSFDISTTANHIYRITIDDSGNANFFIDGVIVATIAGAVAVTSSIKLTPSVGMYSTAVGGNATTLPVDYILAEQIRA